MTSAMQIVILHEVIFSSSSTTIPRISLIYRDLIDRSHKILVLHVENRLIACPKLTSDGESLLQSSRHLRTTGKTTTINSRVISPSHRRHFFCIVVNIVLIHLLQVGRVARGRENHCLCLRLNTFPWEWLNRFRRSATGCTLFFWWATACWGLYGGTKITLFTVTNYSLNKISIDLDEISAVAAK